MKNFKRKLLSLCLAATMLGAFSTLTVYADPDDGSGDTSSVGGDVGGGDVGGGDVGGGDVGGGDVGGGDTSGDIPVDPPADDTPQDPVSVPDDNYNQGDNTGDDYSGNSGYDDTPSYDNGNDYYDDQQYYDNTGDDYYSTPEPDPQEIYDPGITFSEFEKATDYQTATAATEASVDMYNSNGSSDQTLSADDWNDLELNLSNVSSDGVGDFSFIKNNSSDKDSNFTILLFIFGIVFVLGSLGLLTYIVVSSVRMKKALASGAVTANKNGAKLGKKSAAHAVKRTPYIYDPSKYDTAQIDINQFDDNMRL